MRKNKNEWKRFKTTSIFLFCKFSAILRHFFGKYTFLKKSVVIMITTVKKSAGN